MICCNVEEKAIVVGSELVIDKAVGSDIGECV